MLVKVATEVVIFLTVYDYSKLRSHNNETVDMLKVKMYMWIYISRTSHRAIQISKKILKNRDIGFRLNI